MLEYIPEIIVSGWDCNDTHGSRMLEGYLGILNAGTLTGDAEGRCKFLNDILRAS